MADSGQTEQMNYVCEEYVNLEEPEDNPEHADEVRIETVLDSVVTTTNDGPRLVEDALFHIYLHKRTDLRREPVVRIVPDDKHYQSCLEIRMNSNNGDSGVLSSLKALPPPAVSAKLERLSSRESDAASAVSAASGASFRVENCVFLTLGGNGRPQETRITTHNVIQTVVLIPSEEEAVTSSVAVESFANVQPEIKEDTIVQSKVARKVIRVQPRDSVVESENENENESETAKPIVGDGSRPPADDKNAALESLIEAYYKGKQIAPDSACAEELPESAATLQQQQQLQTLPTATLDSEQLENRNQHRTKLLQFVRLYREKVHELSNELSCSADAVLKSPLDPTEKVKRAMSQNSKLSTLVLKEADQLLGRLEKFEAKGVDTLSELHQIDMIMQAVLSLFKELKLMTAMRVKQQTILNKLMEAA